MQLPPDLSKGARIRIVAPSGVFAPDAFQAGIKLIEAEGFEVVVGHDIMSRQRYLAGDDARRANELQTALADRHADAIWIARGGYGATRLLPALDLAVLQIQPKWLVGFSDATALHAAFQRAGLASLHAANVTTLMQWSDSARDEVFAWLRGTSRRLTLQGETVTGQAPVRGRLAGGNLTVLSALAGTPYLPPMQDAIVALEDVGERPYRLDRVLTQLIQGGAFQGVRGFALGQLTDCGTPASDASLSLAEVQAGHRDDALAVMAHVLHPLSVPIVAHLPFGHDAASRCLPLGTEATLDPKHGTLTIG